MGLNASLQIPPAANLAARVVNRPAPPTNASSGRDAANSGDANPVPPADAVNAALRIVEELRDVLDRAATPAPETATSSTVGASVQLGERVPLAAIEEEHIKRVLSATASFEEAAAVLGINGATLWRRRKKYGI